MIWLGRIVEVHIFNLRFDAPNQWWDYSYSELSHWGCLCKLFRLEELNGRCVFHSIRLSVMITIIFDSSFWLIAGSLLSSKLNKPRSTETFRFFLEVIHSNYTPISGAGWATIGGQKTVDRCLDVLYLILFNLKLFCEVE